MSGADFTGLVLVPRTGVPWRWAGYRYVVNRRGEPVRLERWEAPCRACDRAFSVYAKLPAAIGRQFVARRSRACEVRYAVPAGKRISVFELRNCEEHRGYPDPGVLV